MDILVATISGGNFPYQLSALTELCHNGYRPSVSMGGSGGAIAIYCTAAGQWKPSGIERVARSLCHSMIIDEESNVVRKVIPNYVYNYFQGSVYKSSKKSAELLGTYFTPSKIVRDEIWVAAINEATNNVALFCNRKLDNAAIKGEYLNRRLHSYEEIRYQEGNINDIAMSLQATSAIPMLIEPVKIDKCPYVDCGIKYGSPLTPLSNELLSIARKQGIHITYLSGYNIQSSRACKRIRHCEGNIGDHLKTIPSHLVRSIVEHDRNVAYSVINDACEKEPLFISYRISSLKDALRLKSESKCSLIEIYPDCEDSINIFNFNGDDVVEFMDCHKDTLCIRMWYCPK